jgi:hypothetical protein
MVGQEVEAIPLIRVLLTGLAGQIWCEMLSIWTPESWRLALHQVLCSGGPGRK